MASGGVLVVLLAGFALAGCTSGDPAGPSSGDNAGAAEAAADEVAEAEPEAGDEADADDTTAAPAGAATGAGCLVGDWLADNRSFVELIAPTIEANGAAMDATGTVVLSFGADGQTTTEYSDWSFTISQDGTDITLRRDGIDRGTYAVESGSRLTVTETSAESTVEMLIGDQPYGAQPRPEGQPLNSGEFTCTPQTLTVVAEGSATEFTRQ